MDKKINEMNEEQAEEELKKGYDKAKKLLEDTDKIEVFLQKIEKN